MPTTAQLRLVVPADVNHQRRAAEPDEQVIHLTVESGEKLLLTVVEAAQRLGIGRTLMYELLRPGQIDSVHVGRLHKVPVDALAAFVERRGERRSERSLPKQTTTSDPDRTLVS